MDQDRTKTWVEAYVAAWRTNAEADIRGLFAPDATYRTSPFAKPWEGLDEIVSGWLARRDIGEEWTFRYEVLVETAALGIIRGWTTYRNPLRSYSNMWVVTFDAQGRATSFTEWWMKADPDQSGQDA